MIRIIGGILLGGIGGYLLGNVKTCSSQACRSRSNRIYTVIAGAVFGAGVAVWLSWGS
ncbi:MAG: hypothetical protein ACLFUJ_15085 [Phycisphaerae bacterium]